MPSFPGGSVVKNPPANKGDSGSISELGRSPGGGNGNPLQYSCLENPMDRGAWRAAVHGVPKSRTSLSERARMHTGGSLPLGTPRATVSLLLLTSLRRHGPRAIFTSSLLGPGSGACKNSFISNSQGSPPPFHLPLSRHPPQHCK